MKKSTAYATGINAREIVAGEVRAALARVKLNSNLLPQYIGKSQRYWYERLNANLAFSVDDLALISYMLDVPMTEFMPASVSPIGPETKNGPTAGTVGPRKLLELDSNQQPIVLSSERAKRRGITRIVEHDQIATVTQLRAVNA